ncbi:DUF3303 domain-containing protein [Occallatibacter riparius]|uniref:DUF3303 domain-containing protein n=1 Tax=Occallatibacter riparius TaxID=1002689 RepID=A0A9J7BNW6_9BACT|nr:DUF3303 domain-containing protein [Occallatibacter riparius]UWZ83442.1 DUF3303 domain-containing protein [Occallatibacter riparius]
MKIMSTYSLRAGCVPEAANRFISGKGTPPAGITLLGRWHKSDSSGGYALYETDDPAKLFEFAASWSDVLELHSHLVVEDDVAGPALAKIYGGK